MGPDFAVKVLADFHEFPPDGNCNCCWRNSRDASDRLVSDLKWGSGPKRPALMRKQMPRQLFGDRCSPESGATPANSGGCMVRLPWPFTGTNRQLQRLCD